MLAKRGPDDRVRARTRVLLENEHATYYFQANETKRREMVGIHDNDLRKLG